MKSFIYILLLFVSFIGFSQEDAVVSPKIAIKIPLGETIQLENHAITFKKVIEDSRCPTGVTCIWAGRAKVLVEISEKGKDTIKKELIFGEIMQGESNNKILFTYKNSQVIGMMLNPYPNSENTDQAAPYVLLVYIKK